MFGQVVIGPPGSGKTTYCKMMKEFLTGLGRKVAIVNLDPGNDVLPYECAVDVSMLITVDDAMQRLHLGPNGGTLFCMDYLLSNCDWLEEQLKPLRDSSTYVLFDCPGQSELYTHHTAVSELFAKLRCQLTAVYLVDSTCCTAPTRFVSAVLTALSAMLRVALPHVNVLSKCDLLAAHARPAFNLDFFTEVLDLHYLLDQLQDDPVISRYKKLNEAIVGLIEDYSLVSFTALDIENKESMLRLARTIDKANGYVFDDLEERDLRSLMSCAVSAEFEYEKIANIQENYMDAEMNDVEDKGDG